MTCTEEAVLHAAIHGPNDHLVALPRLAGTTGRATANPRRSTSPTRRPPVPPRAGHGIHYCFGAPLARMGDASRSPLVRPGLRVSRRGAGRARRRSGGLCRASPVSCPRRSLGRWVRPVRQRGWCRTRRRSPRRPLVRRFQVAKGEGASHSGEGLDGRVRQSSDRGGRVAQAGRQRAAGVEVERRVRLRATSRYFCWT